MFDRVAETCNEGTISPEDWAEYEAYAMAGQIVAVLEAKARGRLETTPHGREVWPAMLP